MNLDDSLRMRTAMNRYDTQYADRCANRVKLASFGVMVLVLSLALGAVLMAVPVKPDVAVTFTFFGVFLFAGGSLLTLSNVWLLTDLRHEFGTVLVEEEQDEEEQPPPTEEPIKLTVKTADNQVRYTTTTLTPSEWKRLAVALGGRGWEFKREWVAEAGVFGSLTRHWMTIKDDFIRAGVVDGFQITTAGKRALVIASSTPLPIAMLDRDLGHVLETGHGQRALT